MSNNAKKHLTFAAVNSPPARPGNSKSSHGDHYLFGSATGRQSPPESSAMFRSVSMGGAEAPPLFAHSPPRGGLLKSHSSPIVDTPDLLRPSNPSKSATDSSPRVPVEQWFWKLAPEHVLPVPIYHPMERSAVSVPDLPAEEITKRISTFMKQNSISAEYENATSRVQCVSDDLVKFVVQLWQCPSGDGIIIEIQRRQGCCVAMQTIRHRLLEAIQTGKGMEPLPQPSRSTCGVVQTLIEKSILPPPPDSLQCGAAALDLAKGLLHSVRLDAQRLGLESLCSLTNPAQVFIRDADLVSETILIDSDWQSLLGKYFETSTNDSSEGEHPYPDDNMELSYEKGGFFGAIHFLALKVVCQAAESMASLNRTIDLTTPFWTSVLEALYHNVSVASQRPLEAAWSIRCFRHLQLIQPGLLQTIPNMEGFHDYLVHARDFGRQYHRALEMETEQWLGRLGIAH